MKAKFGKVVFVDSFGDPRINLTSSSINGNRSTAVEDFPEAAEPEFFDRGNRSKVIQYVTSRVFDTEDQAEKFANTLDEEFPIKEDLEVTGTNGDWRLFYHGAICTQSNAVAEGCEVMATYTFTTGLSSKK